MSTDSLYPPNQPAVGMTITPISHVRRLRHKEVTGRLMVEVGLEPRSPGADAHWLAGGGCRHLPPRAARLPQSHTCCISTGRQSDVIGSLQTVKPLDKSCGL